MMKKVQQGFTLIELMIVVAIIGILAAIAIPAYQDYTIRAQVTEGLNLASAVKTGVSESFANTGIWPTDYPAAGGGTQPPSGKYVSLIEVTDGTITITFGNDVNDTIDGDVLALQPQLSNNNDVVWVCGYNTAAAAAAAGLNQPAGGNNSPAAAGATTIDPKYLPQNCRDDT